MKILLLEDIYKQGVAGEVVDVAPGYARNYLIPRGQAVKATPGSLRQLENLRKQAVVRRTEQSKHFSAMAEKVEGLTLYFGVKAGETGKLYGSVTTGDIAERLQEEIGLEIDRRRIGDRPLRELGNFAVPVRLEAGLAPTVKVVIHREGEDPFKAEAEAEAASAAAALIAAEAEAEAEAAAELEEVELDEAAVEEAEAEEVEEAEADDAEAEEASPDED
jgi:large subunit ribosomal protein L9